MNFFTCNYRSLRYSTFLATFTFVTLNKDVSAQVRCRISTTQLSREYTCKDYEYCCGNGSCCTQTYALWYMWLIMVVMIVGCCLFGCWYKKWRYRAQTISPRRSQVQNTIFVTENNHITTVTLEQVKPPSYAQVLKINETTGSIIFTDEPPPYPGSISAQISNSEDFPSNVTPTLVAAPPLFTREHVCQEGIHQGNTVPISEHAVVPDSKPIDVSPTTNN